jgi:hypothetical protein
MDKNNALNLNKKLRHSRQNAILHFGKGILKNKKHTRHSRIFAWQKYLESPCIIRGFLLSQE